ncbi:MAG: hypothetical protein E6J78_02430 [Deltaproteobacteria bacterium]|nr:MAG: hypothetical protein E6J78_02430 [Deltaproteobacteria bacterium]
MFDGIAWQARPSPTTASVTFIRGSAADDVWARGDAQNIFHWDGAQWTQPGSAPDSPYSDRIDWRGYPIWPVGGGRSWSGGCHDGASASLYFWDGTRWSRTDTGVPGCVQAIAGTSPADVWATSAIPCGRGCTSYKALHWDGLRWSEASTGLPIAGDFFSPGPGEVWFDSSSDTVFARREAAGFRAFFSLPYIGRPWYWTALAAASLTDVFIVGDGGLLAHSDGKTTKIFTGPNTWLGALWSDASGHAWTVGGGILMERQNGCWSGSEIGQAAYSPQFPAIGPMGLGGGAASDPENLWMMSNDGFAIHWDGRSFSQHLLPWGLLLDLWMSPAGHAYVAATSGLYRADASGFTLIDAPDPSLKSYDADFTGVWGTSDGDIWWLKGEPGGAAVVHFDGVSKAITAHLPWPPAWTGQVRGLGGNDIWAIVRDSLMHFDGVSQQDLSPAPKVYSIAIAAHGDVWAATHDALWHFNGRSWSKDGGAPGMLSVSGGTVYSLGLGRICRKP